MSFSVPGYGEERREETTVERVVLCQNVSDDWSKPTVAVWPRWVFGASATPNPDGATHAFTPRRPSR